MTSRELRSRRLLIMVSAAALVVAAGYSWAAQRSARTEVDAAYESLAECRALVDAIRELNQRPRVVALQASSQTSLSAQVEAAVEAVGLDTAQLKLIEHLPQQRISETQYVNQATRIEVEQATLRQILLLVEKLEAEGAGFRLRDLVLTPRQSSRPARELWDVDAVLTQTVFSPTTR